MEENKVDITPEEFDKFSKAFKDETFRKMLYEYAEEISDPENKRKREEEIAMLERERGMDVQFVKPEAGYVIKTINMKDNLKIFINMCSSDQVQEAICKEEVRGGKVGKGWSIPFITTPPREDLDKAGKKCEVIDVLFHPKTFNMGQQDERMKKMLIDTALNDGLLNQLKITVDRNNLKFPKMNYKGQPSSSVIRKSMAKDPIKPAGNIDDSLQFPFPSTESEFGERKISHKKASRKHVKASPVPLSQMKDGRTTPKYKIIHRGHVDYQNFTMARTPNSRTRPQELVIEIELPLASSASGFDLDIFEKHLILDSKSPNYYMNIPLPYPVNEDNGHAKFDKSTKTLIVTLPVIEDQPCPSLLPQDDNIPLITELGETIEKGDHTEPTKDFQQKKCEGHKKHVGHDKCEGQKQVQNNGVNISDNLEETQETMKQCIQSGNTSIKSMKSKDLKECILHEENQYQTQKWKQQQHKSCLESNLPEKNTLDNIRNHKLDKHEQQTQQLIENTSNELISKDKISIELDENNKETSNLTLSTSNKLSSTDETSMANLKTSEENKQEKFANIQKLGLHTQVKNLNFEGVSSCKSIHNCSNCSGVILENYSSCESKDTCHCDEADTAYDVEHLQLMNGIPGMYKLPPYTFKQDEHSITIDINIPNVRMERVSMGFHEQKVYFSCPSNPHDIRSPYWCLFLKFVDSCKLVSDLCAIDLEGDKVVLCLQKSESSSYMWNKFLVGYSEQTLKESFFLANHGMSEILDQTKTLDPWEPSNDKSNGDMGSNCSGDIDSHFPTVQLEGQLDRLLREQNIGFSYRKESCTSQATASTLSYSSMSQTSNEEADDLASDLKINITMDELQDDVIIDEISTTCPRLSHPPPQKSRSIDMSIQPILRPIIKRSKSESYDYSESWDEVRSEEYLHGANNRADLYERRHKSVSFNPEETVFEFTQLSKKQLKKMRKMERKQEALALFRKGNFKKGKNKKGEKGKSEQAKGDIPETVKCHMDETIQGQGDAKLECQHDTAFNGKCCQLLDSISGPSKQDYESETTKCPEEKLRCPDQEKLKATEEILKSPKKQKKKKKRNRLHKNSCSDGEQSNDDVRTEPSYNTVDKNENGLTFSNTLIFELDD